jgi:hypothetical protein
VDFHARQQSISYCDATDGELHQLGVTPVVLLPPFGSAADLGGVAEPYFKPEFSEQLLEPGAVAAGLQPNDDLAGESRVEAADVIPLVMKLQVMYLAVVRVTVAD